MRLEGRWRWMPSSSSSSLELQELEALKMEIVVESKGVRFVLYIDLNGLLKLLYFIYSTT
ncbi:hypothetical protein HanXRQr2_Chr01g0004511 [Helianthus annuus]|uniref:Uncharacterized protein n=1 Tax=Helianthus annuus TaxID=4232 RepID=A0A9K3JT08_HELAN|nr:hypothetical protein HanXRQr2_Chr01g0004511 [Helianthus annuus]